MKQWVFKATPPVTDGSGYDYTQALRVDVRRIGTRSKPPNPLKLNGEPYLEAHHLLALSEDGPDTPDNVVALCATHHREAHYGRDRAKLEAAVVEKRKGGVSASLGI